MIIVVISLSVEVYAQIILIYLMRILSLYFCRLAYLHEDIEPQIVHQNVKACNILLDHQWNPQISDIAISRLLSPEHSRVTTRSMVKLGSVYLNATCLFIFIETIHSELN